MEISNKSVAINDKMHVCIVRYFTEELEIEYLTF